MELESIQRRFTRLIDEVGTLPTSRRRDLLNLTTLAKQRIRGDLIKAFKVISGLLRNVLLTSRQPWKSAPSCHPCLIQLFWHNKAFGAVCEIDNGGIVLVVVYVVDGEVGKETFYKPLFHWEV